VISLSGTTLSVTANPGEGTTGSSVTTYTVDISKAELKSWGTTCLTPGQHLRVKGALTGTSMVALEVEIVGACLNAAVATAPTPPAPPASAASNPT
jgi:hypothetical protein